MIRSWSKAIAAVAFDNDSAAKKLFSVVLTKGCGLDETSSGAAASTSVGREVREAFSHTLISSSNFLAAVAIETHLRTLNSESAYRVLEASAQDIIQQYQTCSMVSPNSETEGHEFASKAQRAASMLVVALLARITGCSLDAGLATMNIDDCILTIYSLYTQASRATQHRVDILEMLPSLICSVAQISTRFRPTTTFEETERLANALADYESEISTSSIWFLRRLAVDAAAYFARTSDSAKHFAFADEVKAHITESGEVDLRLNPFLASADGDGEAPGFRWEDGICEWVAATPKLVLKKPKILADKIPMPKQVQDVSEGKASLHLSHVVIQGTSALDAGELYVRDSIAGASLRGGGSPVPRHKKQCQLKDITNVAKHCERRLKRSISELEDDEDELTNATNFVQSTRMRRSMVETEDDADELSFTETRKKRQRRMKRAPQKRDLMECLSHFAVFGRDEMRDGSESVVGESDDELSGF